MIQPFDELDWVMKFFNNAVDLKVDGIDRIRNFVFLWNIFETFACNKNANIDCIKKVVERINNKEQLNSNTFESFVDYFANRYFNPSDKTYTIDGLEFGTGNTAQVVRAEVISVLQKQEVQPKEIVTALLIILYRFRNNLFHGKKQIVNLESQIDNFTVANHILSIVLDIMKRNQMIVV